MTPDLCWCSLAQTLYAQGDLAGPEAKKYDTPYFQLETELQIFLKRQLPYCAYRRGCFVPGALEPFRAHRKSPELIHQMAPSARTIFMGDLAIPRWFIY